LIRKVRELRDDGVKAYYSMQTGPSVFVNTSEKDEGKVLKAVQKLGYRAYISSVGGEAAIV
jgi:mevalonate pyrophosphate decarboxylase